MIKHVCIWIYSLFTYTFTHINRWSVYYAILIIMYHVNNIFPFGSFKHILSCVALLPDKGALISGSQKFIDKVVDSQIM